MICLSALSPVGIIDVKASAATVMEVFQGDMYMGNLVAMFECVDALTWLAARAIGGQAVAERIKSDVPALSATRGLQTKRWIQ